MTCLRFSYAITLVLSNFGVEGWNFQIKPPSTFLNHCNAFNKFLVSAGISLCTIAPTAFPGSFVNPKANAGIAQLADVGVKEFLVKDGRQFLRLTLPLGDHGKYTQDSKDAIDMKVAQENLELARLRFEQVGFTNPSAWTAALKDANLAAENIKSHKEYLTASSSKDLQVYSNELMPTLQSLMDSIRSKDIENTIIAEEKAGQLLADLRQAQLPANTLPFSIPEEYNSLPRLNGRAKVEMVVRNEKGMRVPSDPPLTILANTLMGNKDPPSTIEKEVTFELTVDGYHTPLSAGNFVDLVNKGFYNNMPIQRVDQLFVQSGKPKGQVEGYVDPSTGTERTVPLELFYKTDSEPVYSITSDDDLRNVETMALPFQAYGAIGMARGNEDVDSGSSQFFFVKWFQALIAPGRNTLDGFYSCMGYVTRNEQLLSQIKEKDVIVSAKVVEGLQNLQLPNKK